ncbi:MAG: type II secretion system secretin GspD [Candidatus Sedimenticola endophacoides]
MDVNIRMRLGRFAAILFLSLQVISGHALAESQELMLNFKDADIRALISSVSELTGKNFVVDPRVNGKVTVISSSPTSNEHAYDIFLSVLKVHGYAAIPSGDVIKIVPDASANQDSIRTVTNADATKGDATITRIVEVHNVAASQLIPILRPLMPQQAYIGAHPDSNVLIISDSAANVNRVVKIVARIDRVSDQGLEVITIEHERASDLVKVLTSLQRSSGNGNSGVQTRISMVADERTNSILLGGAPQARMQYRALISHLDTPGDDQGNTEVIYLRYALAKEMVEVLKGIGTLHVNQQSGENNSMQPSRLFQIQADEATNALVITAPPEIMRSLKSVITKLDIRRAQVLVEGIIAEVTSDRAIELGIEWQTSQPGNGIYGVTNLPLSTGIGSTLAGFTSKIGSGLGMGFFSGGELRSLLKALAGDGSTNILSTPSLVTLDNEKATIHIGENVPFVTGQYTSTANGGDNPFQTIERHDVGIKLSVTPQINEGDTVKLVIDQEVSSVKNDTSGSGLTTNKRTISTTVLVDNNQMIVLGGLVTDDLQENTQKVPLLGDIPVVGQLFRSQRASLVKKNLMVFLHPVIIRDERTGTLLTATKYRNIEAMQLHQINEEGSLFDQGEVPVLRKMNEDGTISPAPVSEILLDEVPQASTGVEKSSPFPW